MWFDPVALSKTFPPATLATSATFYADFSDERAADSEKSQESQKSQAPHDLEVAIAAHGTQQTGRPIMMNGRALPSLTADYRRDRQEGQVRRIVLWCEASGMVPQLQRVANEYGVPVKSSGGFDSLTVKHALSCQLGADKPATVLHIGDFDPSGEVMFDALAEDNQHRPHSSLGNITPKEFALKMILEKQAA